MNNIRDFCDQSDAKKLLMMVLATYSNGDGLCFPGNLALADAMNKSGRTVKRMLKELKADGELEILRPGIGRGQKRIIRLTRYAAIKGDKAMTPKGDKAMTRLNGTRSLGKAARNIHDNIHEQPSDRVRKRTQGTVNAQAVASSTPESGVFGEGHQNQPAQNHVKWPEFAAWCRSEGAKTGKGGNPTEAGFWKWLCGQKPQWRNRVRKEFDEEGYELNGKFYTRAEANELAAKNPELLSESKFREAVKRGDKFQIVQPSL
jgi:hypothetical protein